MMEALRSSETSERNIPEDGFLHSHRPANLKSYTVKKHDWINAPKKLSPFSYGLVQMHTLLVTCGSPSSGLHVRVCRWV
jgi:hypothetical protein